MLCDRDRDVLCEHIRPDGKSRQAFGCFGCEYKNDAYPPFTAEKQLELIKWLVKSKSDVTICYSNVTKRFAISKRGGYCVSEDFATALVIKINLLWQDLTDAEKEQIKNILE